MSKDFENIDDLFQSELNQAPVDPPASVKAGIDAGIGFGVSPVDDLFKSEMGDAPLDVPASVKSGIDSQLGFGEHPVDDVFKSEMADVPVAVPETVKANIYNQLTFRGKWGLRIAIPSLLLLAFLVAYNVSDFETENSGAGGDSYAGPVNATNIKGDANGFVAALMSTSTESGINDTHSGANEFDSENNNASSSGESSLSENQNDSNTGSQNYSNQNRINSDQDQRMTVASGSRDAERTSATTGSGDGTTTNSGTISDPSSTDENGTTAGSDVAIASNENETGDNRGNEQTGTDENSAGETNEVMTDGTGEDGNKEGTSGSTENGNDNGDVVEEGSDEKNTNADNSETSEATTENESADQGTQGTPEKENNTEENSESATAENPSTENTNDKNSEDAETTDNQESTSEDPPAIPIDKKKKSNYKPFFLTASYGLNFSKTHYSSPTYPQEQLYQTSVEDKLGQEFQFDGLFILKHGLTIGTGLHFSQYNETYNFLDQFWTHDSTENLELVWGTEWDYEYGWEYELDSMMIPIDSTWVVMDSTSTEVVEDSLITFTYDSTQVTNYNASGMQKATYFSIPFHFGTQIEWKRFRFGIMATVRYNILMNARGKYYDGSSIIGFTQKSNNIYRKTYFDFQFAGSVHYNIWKDLYVSAVVRFRPPFKDMYEGTNFNKKMHYTHVGIGLSYNF